MLREVARNTATGIRTPVSAVRGRRPSPLDDSGATPRHRSKGGPDNPDGSVRVRTYVPWHASVNCTCTRRRIGGCRLVGRCHQPRHGAAAGNRAVHARFGRRNEAGVPSLLAPHETYGLHAWRVRRVAWALPRRRAYRPGGTDAAPASLPRCAVSGARRRGAVASRALPAGHPCERDAIAGALDARGVALFRPPRMLVSAARKRREARASDRARGVATRAGSCRTMEPVAWIGALRRLRLHQPHRSLPLPQLRVPQPLRGYPRAVRRDVRPRGGEIHDLARQDPHLPARSVTEMAAFVGTKR
ncbi:MAG: hypothetical protein QOD24_3075 [Solirubrobacteraceae bacterium]|nr:hypothetical protein [Solirubrobacteraceae bacterium]